MDSTTRVVRRSSRRTSMNMVATYLRVLVLVARAAATRVRLAYGLRGPRRSGRRAEGDLGCGDGATGATGGRLPLPVHVRVGDDLRRVERGTPLARIVGGVSVLDERGVVAPHEGAMQRGPDAGVGLGAGDDEVADLPLGQALLEVRLLERVAEVLELLVGVLYPDDRRAGIARPLQHGADVGDHAVTLVGVGDDVVLHVHDQKSSVRAVRDRCHVDLLRSGPAATLG